MSTIYPSLGLSRLCGWFGISRQAYYQYRRRDEEKILQTELLLKQIHLIRSKHPRMGGRKLYRCLLPFFQAHEIKMGRDALFDLLAANKLLIKRRARKSRTTYSDHWYRKYPNLIRSFIPSAPNQLWVSDITYWPTELGFFYVSLVSDAYSRRIMGYYVSTHLGALGCRKALKMALSHLRENGPGADSLIHHSDRGIQYCSLKYVKLLQDHQIQISMTENGDPLENPIAERINGIIKEEYLQGVKIYEITQARKLLKEKVNLYNQERPHMSLGYLNPEKVHKEQLAVKRQWKNYYKRSVNPFQDYDSFVNLNQD